MAALGVHVLSVQCNWGQPTMEHIQQGFDAQGPYIIRSSSCDGRGPGTNDEPRMVLGNVVVTG